jgi:hypothetical protein
MLFSNGCYIEPVLCEINGEEKKWRFIVTNFEDQVFFNGEDLLLKECADTIEELIDCKFNNNEICQLNNNEKCNGCGFLDEYKK